MSFQVQGLLLFREGFAETHFLDLESHLAQAVRGCSGLAMAGSIPQVSTSMHICLAAGEPWVLCSSDKLEQQSFLLPLTPSAFPATQQVSQLASISKLR